MAIYPIPDANGAQPSQPQYNATLDDVSRADVARERAWRLRAEASAVAAEARAMAAEDRAATAEWLVTVLRGELTDARRHRWWRPWSRRAVAGWQADAEEMMQRMGGLGPQQIPPPR